MVCYCKKCKQDVPVGEVCPLCGGALGPGSLRVHWQTVRRPFTDWISWNRPLRLILPAFALLFALIVGLERIFSGRDAAFALLLGPLLPTMGMLLVLVLFVLAAVLALQGKQMLTCTMDRTGIHLLRTLINPTPLQQLMNGCFFRQERPDENGLISLPPRELKWRDIARVQLWPEKGLILFYAPHWWMRVALPCLPATWGDALAFLRDKVGKKKNLLLPPALRVDRQQ